MTPSDHITAGPPLDAVTAGQALAAEPALATSIATDDERFRKNRFGSTEILLLLGCLMIGFLIAKGFLIRIWNLRWNGPFVRGAMRDWPWPWQQNPSFPGLGDSVDTICLVPWLVGTSWATAALCSLMCPTWLPANVRWVAIKPGLGGLLGVAYGFYKVETDLSLNEGPYLVAYGPLVGVIVGLILGGFLATGLFRPDAEGRFGLPTIALIVASLVCGFLFVYWRIAGFWLPWVIAASCAVAAILTRFYPTTLPRLPRRLTRFAGMGGLIGLFAAEWVAFRASPSLILNGNELWKRLVGSDYELVFYAASLAPLLGVFLGFILGVLMELPEAEAGSHPNSVSTS